MSQAQDKINAQLHNWGKDIARVTIFIRKEQLEGQSLDMMLQPYVMQGWFIIVRQVHQQPGVFGVVFAKDSKHHYGPNPNFIKP
ncbi:MAG TPA: hypothetical protein VM577_14380 [Anaerovoracaceae bacterium]|nr:hypothetical protein [Anaerovoracaceae bacterium]